MSSNMKLWRIMANNLEREGFLKHIELAKKVRSSIDHGLLEGRPAEIVGIIIGLAWGNRTNFTGNEGWGASSLKLHAARFDWPDTTSILVEAGRNLLAMSREEAELYLEVAQALVETSLQEQVGISFEWYEEKN